MRATCHRVVPLLVFLTFVCTDDAERKVTQDDLGNLHGDFARMDKPDVSVALGSIQTVRSIWLAPNAKRALIHEWKTDESKQKVDRLLEIDPVTAKVERVLAETVGRWMDHRSVQFTPDSKSAFTRNPKTPGLIRISLDTGQITQTIPCERLYGSLQFDSGATRAAAMTDAGGAVMFDLTAGKAEYLKLAFLPKNSPAMVYPLTGRSELLLHYGIAESQKNIISLLDPKTAKAQAITEFVGNATIVPAPDGKTTCVFRQENPGAIAWTSVEIWDLHTLKRLARHPLKPPLASIGLKLTDDGKTLFLHEYIVQPIVVFDLRTGQIAGVIGPVGGGCGSFDVSPDGKQLIATIGIWKQGTLLPRELGVYDIAKLLSKP